MRTKALSIVAAFVALMLLPAMTWALKIKDVKGEYNGREIDVTGKNVGSISVGSNITIKIKTDKKFKKAEIKFHHLPNSFNLDKKNDDESVKFSLGPFNDPGERNFTVKVFKDKKDKKADDTFDGRFYVAGNQSTPKPPKPPVPPPVPPGDKEKPRLHSFAPNKSTIRVGETVEISYTVSDVGGSGLRQVELWRGKEKGNLGHYKTDTIKGNGPVSGKFTDSPSPAGTYYYGIHILDNKDNLTYDNGALPVSVVIDPNKTVLPPGLPGNKSEECVTAVRALMPWTNAIRPPSPGYAKQWTDAATKAGFAVDKNPVGCTESTPCVLIYKPEYGSGIDKTAGHAAVYYGGSKILDSNGICGGYRNTCNKQPDFNKAVYVIHPSINLNIATQKSYLNQRQQEVLNKLLPLENQMYFNPGGNKCVNGRGDTWCYAFARDILGVSQRYYRAIDAFNNLPGVKKETDFSSIPIGAMVFWDANKHNANLGHAAIKINNSDVMGQGSRGLNNSKECQVTRDNYARIPGSIIGYYAP